jgi:hypothetical protein
MLLNAEIKVKCVNPDCAKPADTRVPIEEVAPGVLAYPGGRDLRCKSCGHAIWTEPVDA